MKLVDPATLPPEAREDYAKDLALWEQIVEDNPLQGYEPHPKQALFHAAQTKIKAFIGGNRTGKTTAGVVDDLIQAVDQDCLPESLQKYKKWDPPFYCRIISPDITRTMEGVLYDKIKEYVPRSQLAGGSWDEAFEKSRRILRFANGSWIDFMSYGMDREQFGGVKLHRAHYDEEPGDASGEAIQSETAWRLVDYNGDELYSMTPLFGYSWVKDDVWDKRHESDVTAVKVSVQDNPHLDQEGLKAALASCKTKEEYDARTKGDFAHFGGLFYPEFTDAAHVVEAPARAHLADQNIVVGIDPGLRKSGIVWVAFDNDNAAVVFDEFYPEEMVVGPVAQAIKQRNKRWGISPTYVIDPSARNRTQISAENIEAEFAREEIYCQHGQNERGAGILEVKGRLQQSQLTVSRECTNLIWEFGRYRRDPNAADEFASIKADDHLLDALRYAVMSRAWGLRYRPPQPKPDYSDPMVEPPFKAPTRTSNPPLGVMS